MGNPFGLYGSMFLCYSLLYCLIMDSADPCQSNNLVANKGFTLIHDIYHQLIYACDLFDICSVIYVLRWPFYSIFTQFWSLWGRFWKYWFFAVLWTADWIFWFFIWSAVLETAKNQNFKISLIGLWRTIKPIYVPKIIEFGSFLTEEIDF